MRRKPWGESHQAPQSCELFIPCMDNPHKVQTEASMQTTGVRTEKHNLFLSSHKN